MERIHSEAAGRAQKSDTCQVHTGPATEMQTATARGILATLAGTAQTVTVI